MMRLCLSALLMAGCLQRVPVFDADDAGPLDAARDIVPVDGSADADAADSAMPPTAFGMRLAAGLDHACAIDGLGALQCWGVNESGQLGVGERSAQSPPVSIDGTWISVAAGGNSTCAINADRELFCWGANPEGGVGVGDREDRLVPTLVSLSGPVTSVDVGQGFACAIASSELYCWGANDEGQLAQDDGPTAPVEGLTPLRVAGGPYREVYAGEGHACVLADGGRVACWGRNTDSILGFPESVAEQARSPRQLEGRWLVVAPAQFHTCAIDDSSRLQCWGRGGFGRTGQGDEARRDRPAPVAMNGDEWADLDASWFHTCGTRLNGSLWCFGWNEQGMLGMGDRLVRLAPEAVNRSASSVAVGRFFTCIRGDTGIACAGRNGEGQLGVVSPRQSDVFVER
ncbi:MAG: hypothetical protein AAF938_08595 [Myxococcota bacterium]